MRLREHTYTDVNQIIEKEAELLAAGFYLTNRPHESQLHTMEYIKKKSTVPDASEGAEVITIIYRIE